jgi:hypothetical protein
MPGVRTATLGVAASGRFTPDVWITVDPAVEKWFETCDNPQKALVQGVRQVILNVDPRILETIKWKAPTFIFRGNIASFYLRSTKHVSLLFHTGAILARPQPDCWKAMGRFPAWRGSAMSLTLQPRLRRYADSSLRGSS